MVDTIFGLGPRRCCFRACSFGDLVEKFYNELMACNYGIFRFRVLLVDFIILRNYFFCLKNIKKFRELVKFKILKPLCQTENFCKLTCNIKFRFLKLWDRKCRMFSKNKPLHVVLSMGGSNIHTRSFCPWYGRRLITEIRYRTSRITGIYQRPSYACC